MCFLSLAVRCQPLSRALGLRREKHNYWEKDLGISLAICLRFSASLLFLSQFFGISNKCANQNPWVASLENRASRLKVSLTQRRFNLTNQMGLTVCF
ncbi:hypothetical protein FKN12_17970 [Vibrio sp. 2-2(8)]|nr:hypothetical protein [Vibrio sp. 2-2(8)]